MIILGLHFGHDGSACVVKNGKLVSAISTERITRVKKEAGVTDAVINYVLDAAGVTLEDVDHIALSEYFDENNNSTLKFFNNDGLPMLNIDHTFFFNNIGWFQCTLYGKTIPVTAMPHHLAHCASAYYTSNFDSAWCMSIDTSFNTLPANSLIAKGEGNKLTAMYCPNAMTGMGYLYFTHHLGLGPSLHKAGTTMGLASYGTPLPEVVENIDQYVDETFFPDNTTMTEYHVYFNELWNKLSKGKKFSGRDSYMPDAMNLAATIQYIFENGLLRCANNIPAEGNKNLCLSGGSLYNCNTNTIIKTKSQFENVHHFPACGDDGICIGSALYAAHHIYDEPRNN
jgi:carbamoyltransferase